MDLEKSLRDICSFWITGVDFNKTTVENVSKLYSLILEGFVVVVVALLFYVHGKHLRSCRDGQLT